MAIRRRIKLFVAASIAFCGFFGFSALAASNINPTEPLHWAWNDVTGWLDFCVPAPGNTNCTLSVNVYDDRLEGYASSSVGYIALNCNTAPAGNCSGLAGNWHVTNTPSPTLGQPSVLSGWGWNDVIGWVSFTCDHRADGTVPPYNVSTCGTSNYGVNIITAAGPTQGDFTGWAWNDVVGWISFNKKNCDADSNGFIDVACGGNNTTTVAIDYKVKTGWTGPGGNGPQATAPWYLVSSAFDTCPSGVDCGAAFNSIMWQGNQLPALATVYFKIASSDSSAGPWNFIGPLGLTHESDIYNAPNPNTPVPLKLHHNNKRYIRYKIYLGRGASPADTPVVRDVIINWSP